jgi:hypothetical protein
MSQASWITVKEFAGRVGLAPSSIRNLLRNGKIKEARLEQTRVGEVWLLPESLTKTFEARTRGRPRKEVATPPAKKARKKGAK